MYFFDPSYYIIVLPAVIFALYAQAKVSSTTARASRVRSGRGLTGRQAVEAILRANGLGEVKVEPTRGPGLGDHYDPASRSIRLSPQVLDRPSVTAVGIAAHEAGHALQHSSRYAFLAVRNGLFPVVQFGTTLAFPGFVYRPAYINHPLRAFCRLGFFPLYRKKRRFGILAWRFGK